VLYCGWDVFGWLGRNYIISWAHSASPRTNSFTFSLGGKIPPTVAIFGSSGLYEITAYVLAAAATTSISKYHLVGKWPKQTIAAIVPPQAESVIQERYAGILLAITILLIACGWEAYRISLAIAP